MEKETSNVTLSEKINGYDPITQIVVRGDVRGAVLRLTPELFHNIYEEEADKVGWETNRKCRVRFDDLPETNQETMIMTVRRIKKLIFGKDLT